jgi:hypothetical protein
MTFLCGCGIVFALSATEPRAAFKIAVPIDL